MSTKSPAACIDQLRQSNSRDDIDFITLYDAYIADPSSLASATLPKDADWEFEYYFLKHVILDLEKSPIYQTVLNIITDLIKTGNETTFLVQTCLEPIDPDYGLKLAEDYEIDQLPMLKALCFCKKEDLDFGWERNGTHHTYTDIGDAEYIDKNKKEADLTLTESLLLNLDDKELTEILSAVPAKHCMRYHAALARHRPEKYKAYLTELFKTNTVPTNFNWEFIIRATDQLDTELIAYADQSNKKYQLQIYTYIDHYRPGTCREKAIAAARTSSSEHALLYLSNTDAQETSDFLYKVITAAQKLSKALKCNDKFDVGFPAATPVWKKSPNDPFAKLLEPIPAESTLWYRSYLRPPAVVTAFKAILLADNISPEEAKEWFQQVLTVVKDSGLGNPEKKELLQEFDKHICRLAPEHFPEQIWNILQDKSKTHREMAINALTKINSPDITTKARELLTAKKIDSRLGAIELLTKLEESSPKDSNIPALKQALTNEKSAKVEDIILKTLHSLGCEDTTPEGEKAPETIAELLAFLTAQEKKIKLPKADWLHLSQLPPLISTDGEPLPELFISYLIQHQAKHKTIDASPVVNPLLDFIDKQKSSAFASDLLQLWLSSAQEAKDRWVLAFAGLIGNDSIIPILQPRIDPWCRNSRHKLAEYAAQSISLLASDSALMVLDSLKNTYSTKFKNVGKACAAAFDAAAVARGVSVDELADMIVPTLGFNDEGHRPFETTDTPIVAILQPDFKLTWLNTDTDKETKSPPATLSAEAKAEIKDLRKLIRTATKAQDMRLEQSLCTQRRWPVRRWQELFEVNVLLQSYASRLVWGIYDSKNTLLRSFRRYDNGILATGGGQMEDLEEDDTFIGILHPLELDESTRTEWLEHLGRFKIKAPFSQMDRPIELLDPNHGNRRQITITDSITISVSTFRSRTEKRNWNRGSVIDGGGISSYYKLFPGAGVEAILETEEHWVGQDYMDTLVLGKALFVKSASIDRGSYVYDEPNPDDDRVLPFADVPAIVYSEVISDLKAIIEGQS